MNSEHTKWISAHIYSTAPWEHFFHSSLLPFVDTAVKTGIITQYFFERKTERGSHLLLCVKGEAVALDTILKPHLEEHFMNYLEVYPSVRVDPDYPPHFPENYKWFPNNTVQFFPYQQNAHQFGGATASSICEEQFYYASVAVLQIIKEKKYDWNYDDAMVNAIQLHVVFAHAVGLSLSEVIQFFQFSYKKGLQGVSDKGTQRNNPQEQEAQTLDLERTYERAFEFQRSVMRRILDQLWSDLNTDIDSLSNVLQDWQVHNQLVSQKLGHIHQMGQLEDRNILSKQEPHAASTTEPSPLWSIYADFVHLLNNKLGIVQRDESFIAFIIIKSLEALEESMEPKTGLRAGE